MNINIRYYQESDYPDLIKLLKEVYCSNISQSLLEKEYLSQTKKIIVAIDSINALVGCTFVEIQEDYIRPRKIAYVTYVAVDENHRKQGIGKRLLSTVEKICHELKCSAIELTSANYRTGAHAFYNSIGYSPKKTTVFIKEIPE